MKRIQSLSLAWCLAGAPLAPTIAGTSGWFDGPLPLSTALDLALRQNPSVLKARKDLEAVHGVVVQTRAIALPKLALTGNYQVKDSGYVDTIDLPFLGTSVQAGGDQSWSAGVRLVQSIYEGGRMSSAWRASRLAKEQALLDYQTMVADALLEVRLAYYDVLLAAQQIDVRDASVRLLEEEAKDATRRRDAGTVPEFNVLRAEVQWASAKPALIRARNAHRHAKIRLANRLGIEIPPGVGEDIPLQLAGDLEAELHGLPSLALPLAQAIARGMDRRTELQALRKVEGVRREELRSARGGYRPSVQAFAGYEGRNSMFSGDLGQEVDGWTAGVQMRWDLFDGRLTEGRVSEAKARFERVQIERDDLERRVELEVRTTHSNVNEALEVLESQRKVREQAQEALRLATARYQAGSGTQLDVLSAETSLTEARTTQIQAWHDYLVARAHLDRATGPDIERITEVQR